MPDILTIVTERFPNGRVEKRTYYDPSTVDAGAPIYDHKTYIDGVLTNNSYKSKPAVRAIEHVRASQQGNESGTSDTRSSSVKASTRNHESKRGKKKSSKKPESQSVASQRKSTTKPAKPETAQRARSNKRHISPLNGSKKRGRLSSNDSSDDDDSSTEPAAKSRPTNAQLTNIPKQPQQSPAYISTEATTFLSNLSEQIYRGVLQNLCPDNMRGSFCRHPTTCIAQNRFFACPAYATLQTCRKAKKGDLTHSGFKHTVKGCGANMQSECGRRHADGKHCRVEVVYFHVRASCVTLYGGSYCQMEPCGWGHDYEGVRRGVLRDV